MEGALEFGRVLLFAAISAALTAGLSYASGLSDPLIQMMLVTLLTSLAKAWDKYTHKNPETDAKGIVPF